MAITISLFDWSGTVSDDSQIVYESNMLIREHFGLPRILIEDFKKEVDVDVAAGCKKNFGIEVSTEDIQRLYRQFYNTLYTEDIVKPTIIPGAKELFEYLYSKGTDIFIVSSHPTEFLEREIEEYGLSPYIKEYFGNLTEKKTILSKLVDGINPSEAIFVGDTEFDVQFGKEVGIKTIAVLKGYHTPERIATVKPDYSVNTIKDIKNHNQIDL